MMIWLCINLIYNIKQTWTDFQKYNRIFKFKNRIIKKQCIKVLKIKLFKTHHTLQKKKILNKFLTNL